jgi:hypothetical protein
MDHNDPLEMTLGMPKWATEIDNVERFASLPEQFGFAYSTRTTWATFATTSWISWLSPPRAVIT